MHQALAGNLPDRWAFTSEIEQVGKRREGQIVDLGTGGRRREDQLVEQCGLAGRAGSEMDRPHPKEIDAI
jgi:hypothetical protein